jgi:hypothetical protein
MNQREKRVRQWVRLIWIEKGRPTGREREFLRLARELVAIEESENITLQPVGRLGERLDRRVPVAPVPATPDATGSRPPAEEGKRS